MKTVPQACVSKLENVEEPSGSTREKVRSALEKAFKAPTSSSDQCSQVLDLGTKYRTVFSLAPSKLGKCTTNTIEKIPVCSRVQPQAIEIHIERTPAFKKSDKCVNQMEKDGIIEQRPSPWRSAITIVARPDGSPRVCVDYRCTIDKSLIRKSWPMSDMEAHIHTVAGAKFITVCDVQSARHQIRVAEAEQDKPTFDTER